MAHVLQTNKPQVSINIPFEESLHGRMKRMAQGTRQSLRQLVLTLVDEGTARWEREQARAEAARG